MSNVRTSMYAADMKRIHAAFADHANAYNKLLSLLKQQQAVLEKQDERIKQLEQVCKQPEPE